MDTNGIGSDAEKHAWVAKVLGVVVSRTAAPSSAPAQHGAPGPGGSVPGSADGAGGKAVSLTSPDPDSALSKTAAQPQVWTRGLGSALQGTLGERPRAPVVPAAPVGPKSSFVNRGGKKLEVVVGKDGRVSLTADPPPIGEITFSGGGGKGAALPGAVRALEETGVLKEARVLRGASVGSMTAAVLAAGMSAETFTKLGNDTKMGPLIKNGDVLPLNLDGEGLESFVRDQIGSSVHGKIAAFLRKGNGKEQAEPGAPTNGIDQQTLDAIRAIDGKISRGGGVTFGDLRTLSKVVPGIKDLVISGTMMGDDSVNPGKIEKGKPQLAIFSADTEPDLDVARAVHASAALPPVFKPVNIKLSSGVTARFQDGGVMNNAPTSDLVGADRSLDPIPEAGQMTFVFEDQASAEILQGEATPSLSRVSDLVSGAPTSAANYAKNRALADRPEDVVMVPLKFKGPWYKRTDFSSFIGGTINFDIPKDARLKLQGMAEDATLGHIKNRKLPETREFGSAGEMLSSVSRDDLEAMAQENFAGAHEELAFRDAVAGGITALEAVAGGAKADSLQKGPVRSALAKLDALAKGDRNRLAFIGRELNRSGKLDPLLDVAKKSGGHGLVVLDAGVAVADALAARSHAQTILREMIYPKMVDESPKGVGGTVLRQVDTMLRGAKTPKDVNDALTIAIRHFANKSDFADRHRHHEFAAELKTYLMKVS
jgi:exoenzyme U